MGTISVLSLRDIQKFILKLLVEKMTSSISKRRLMPVLTLSSRNSSIIMKSFSNGLKIAELSELTLTLFQVSCQYLVTIDFKEQFNSVKQMFHKNLLMPWSQSRMMMKKLEILVSQTLLNSAKSLSIMDLDSFISIQ